ncbi:MAG: phosphotransferase, partial [Eubacteriales bacterium]
MGYRTMDRAICLDLPAAYCLTPTDAIPVDGGWLNRKWKIHTARGPFLVKQFSRTRFRPEHLVQIEAALERQIRVGKAGVPCPEILLSGGRPLRYLDDGTVYMVMTFCEGRAETPETVTAEQLRSLGEVCGRLQKAFSSLPASETAGEPADGTRLLAKLTENTDDAAQTSVPTSHNPRYSAAVAARKPILDTLSPAFFLHLPTGIAHED